MKLYQVLASALAILFGSLIPASAQLRNDDGTLTTPQCSAGQTPIVTNGVWGCGVPSVSLPSGLIVMMLAGTCPTGFAEASALNGKTIVGTVAANKDVGTTGGSDTITPAGTNSALTFTGSALGTHLHGVGTFDNASASAGTPAGTIAWPVGVPVFTGTPFTAVINHTHAVTSVGSAATGAATNLTGASDTSSTTATAANPAGGVSSITPAGTIAWPAGVPTFGGSAMGNHDHALSGSSEAVSAGTPTGTINTPTFTGTQFDNRSAYVKAIFCVTN